MMSLVASIAIFSMSQLQAQPKTSQVVGGFEVQTGISIRITGWLCQFPKDARYVYALSGDETKKENVGLALTNPVQSLSRCLPGQLENSFYFEFARDRWMDMAGQRLYISTDPLGMGPMIPGSGQFVFPPDTRWSTLQGMIVDENFNALSVAGAAVRVRRVSSSSYTYLKAEPTFGIQLRPGYYYVSFEIPGRQSYFSFCSNCTNHPERNFNFVGNYEHLIQVHDGHFQDLRIAAVTRPINVTTALQGMLVTESNQAFVDSGVLLILEDGSGRPIQEIPLTPTFGRTLPAGYYRVRVKGLPGYCFSFTQCQSCTSHPPGPLPCVYEPEPHGHSYLKLPSYSYTDLRIKAYKLPRN